MSSPELHRQAGDPSTDLATLAALAHEHPALRPAVALNPSAYDGLLEWLHGLGDPAIESALAERRGEPGAAPHPLTWREPNRDVPLRWGSYRLRYALSLGLLLGSLLLPLYLVAPSGYTGLFAIAGLAVIAAGVMPAPLARRAVAASLAVAFVLIVIVSNLSYQGSLSNVLFGIYQFVPFETAISVIVWLVLRQRSPLAFLVLPLAYLEFLWRDSLFLVLSDGLWNLGLRGEGTAFRDVLYGITGYLTLVVHAGTVIGLVWLARVIAVARATALHRVPANQLTHSAQREAAQHQARVEQITQWEAAYRDAHGGAEPPPGFSPPAGTVGSTSTNTMAILALIFGFGGGLLGIVFGHIARSQIRRTHEGGWALATVGLVLGYIGLASWVVLIGVYVWFFVLLMG